MIELHEVLEGKWEDGTRPKDLYTEYISKTPQKYIHSIIKGLESDQKRIQSGCAEIGSLLSEDSPELLYPYASNFVSNLDAKAPVLRWEAVCTLGNLAVVDEKKIVEQQVGRLIEILGDKSIVLQGHTVRALTKIVKRFPHRGEQILNALIGATEYFPGNRVGFLVESMETFADLPSLRPGASQFAERYLDSDIKSVASKAKRAVRQLKG